MKEFTVVELCDLMLATTVAKTLANDGGEKWQELHDKIKNIIKEINEQK